MGRNEAATASDGLQLLASPAYAICTAKVHFFVSTLDDVNAPVPLARNAGAERHTPRPSSEYHLEQRRPRQISGQRPGRFKLGRRRHHPPHHIMPQPARTRPRARRPSIHRIQLKPPIQPTPQESQPPLRSTPAFGGGGGGLAIAPADPGRARSSTHNNPVAPRGRGFP